MKKNNIIRTGLHLLFAKATRGRFPFQVHIRVIEQCNQECTYCAGDYQRKGIAPPSAEKLLRLIDDLGRLGTKRITLFGGEPLLRDDIHELILRAKRYNMDCSLTTNGRLIDRHKKILKDLDSLSISLDGDEKSHDAYRGGGSWDAALHAVELARSSGAPVKLMCTVTRLTDPKLYDLRILAERYKCTIDFELLNPVFREDGTVTLRPEDAGEAAVKEFLNYQKSVFSPRFVHSPHVLQYIYKWPAEYKTFRIFRDQIKDKPKLISCNAGRFFAFIESNGDLFPCCLKRTDYHPINVFEHGFEEAWKIMPINDCVACRCVGYNMLNDILNLQPQSVLYFIRSQLNNRFKTDINLRIKP